MHKRVGYLGLAFIFAVFSSGCASLNGDVPFRYQPSLVSSEKINKVAGIEMLQDKRPKDDVAYTKDIKDISEKITSKILEDFDKSKMFEEIHFPVKPGDDIVINGSVDRFKWKLYATPIMYIPLISLFVYFGAPCQEAYGVASITLEVKDQKSGAILGTFTETSDVRTTYSLYNFKAGEAGAELSEAFRDVAKKLKQDILSKVKD